MGTKTFDFPFWQAENFYEAPAHKTVKVSIPEGALIQSAKLTWQVNMADGGFDNIVFNNRTLSTQSDSSADVSDNLVTNGDNTIAINFRRGWTAQLLGQMSGSANVSLQVKIYVNVAGQPIDNNGNTISVGMTEASEGFSFPTWAWALIVLVAILAIVFVILKVTGKANPIGLLTGALK